MTAPHALHLGTWGRATGMKHIAMCHHTDSLIAIERHRRMLHDFYLPVGIRLVAFDPYFIALDKIPKFEALAEVERMADSLREFGQELDRLSVIRYGHTSKYCQILSKERECRRRSFHEIDYLFELTDLIGMIGFAVHLGGDGRSTSAAEDTVRAFEGLDESRLRALYIENTTTPAGRLANALDVARRLPINIAFDVGHFIESAFEDLELYDAIERVLEVTHPAALYIHLSKEVKGRHRDLDLQWSIQFIEDLLVRFPIDLHIVVESPNRLDECLYLMRHFEGHPE